MKGMIFMKTFQVLTLEIGHNIKAIFPHVREIDAENTLQEMYKIIKCDLVTCTEIEVNSKYYDVWSDDEALLKDKPVPTLYLNDDLIICGNVMFATNEKGKTTGLTDEDIRILINFIFDQKIQLHDYVDRINEGKNYE